jgi:hypothetical protein
MNFEFSLSTIWHIPKQIYEILGNQTHWLKMKMFLGLMVVPTVIETFFDRIRSDIVQKETLPRVVLQWSFAICIRCLTPYVRHRSYGFKLRECGDELIEVKRSEVVVCLKIKNLYVLKCFISNDITA